MKSKTKIQGIPSSHYTKEYFFSEYYHAAKDYEQFIRGGNPPSFYLKAFSYIPKAIAGRYLDVGCGKGELVIYLARLGKMAVGIDYSDAAIKICKSTLKHEETPVKRLAQFKVANATHLPFKDESFDAVFLLDTIEHLTKTETEKALNETKRVLKRGGKVVVHTNNKFFERGTKLFIAASYHGLEAFLCPRKFLFQSSHPNDPYEYMHINYVTPTWVAKQLNKRGLRTVTEYPRPEQKSELEKYINYDEKWKKLLYVNLGWMLLNSPLLPFFSPTFWLVGEKRA